MLARSGPKSFWALGPFGDLQNEVGDFFHDLWPANREGSGAYRVDIHEDADHVFIEAELPGIGKDDIEITLEDGVLTIQGEKKQQREENREGYCLSERRYGKFSRRFRVPSVVDDTKVRAELQEGVLHVVLDKREEVKPRRIDVQVK